MTNVILPLPTEREQQACNQLSKQIKTTIIEAGGCISFAQFMQMALYHQYNGYYYSLRQFGTKGDFITAPDLSPLFGQCLGNYCQEIISYLKSYAKNNEQKQTPITIVEIGGGSGHLASSLLKQLESLGMMPDQYVIIEINSSLCELQKQHIKQNCPHLRRIIQWQQQLPDQPFSGIILANELLDALAVERFYIDKNGLQQYSVTVENSDPIQFAWLKTKPSQILKQALKNFSQTYATDCLSKHPSYSGEINTNLGDWLNRLSKILKFGTILLLDYGYPRSEYYHSDRHCGTINCYYKHHYHDNPLIYCGIQDISAHVDFTLVAKEAISANLTVAGYTNQATFLLAYGLNQLINSQSLTAKEAQNQYNAIKKLILPIEMGEAIKVIALNKNIDYTPMGFKNGNRLHQL